MECVSHAACICDVPFTSDWIPEFEGGGPLHLKSSIFIL